MAFICDTSAHSHREWLQSPDNITFRESGNQVRSKRLAIAREAMYENWCQLAGMESASWTPYICEYCISELFLNSELSRLFAKPPDKVILEPEVGIDWSTIGEREREQREFKRHERGKTAIEVIMAGVLALAEKSATDEMTVFG